MRTGRRRSPEATKAYFKEYRANNPEAITRYHRTYMGKNPLMDRQYQIQRRYGLTPYQHEVLFLIQSSCPVCGRQFETDGRTKMASACIHHHHDSGVVVGIWCSNCNAGSGMFSDDPARLREAAQLNEVAA